MPDAKFTILSVPRHAGALAERMAVLKPLTPGLTLAKDEQVQVSARRVLELWRRRCNVLRQEGWELAQSTRFSFMRNCPMAVVHARPNSDQRYTRPCNTIAICPWCWARRVVKRTWDSVTRGMELLHSLYTPERTEYPYKLIVGTQNGRVDDSSSQPGDLINQMQSSMTTTKRAWKRLAIGSAFLAVLYPAKSGNWHYSNRLLALVPTAATVSDQYRVVTNPTRRKVAEAVARFARYPSGLIFGDPDMTIRLLNARAGQRMFRTAGAFYAGTRIVPPDDDEETRFLDI
jgi:hypothetical protein